MFVFGHLIFSSFTDNQRINILAHFLHNKKRHNEQFYSKQIIMDREIPKDVLKKERNRRILKYGGIGGGCISLILILFSLMRSSVKEKDLVFSEVSKGTIEVSVSASGKVVPAFEEIINSPINTRILEVYKKGGDSVNPAECKDRIRQTAG